MEWSPAFQHSGCWSKWLMFYQLNPKDLFEHIEASTFKKAFVVILDTLFFFKQTFLQVWLNYHSSMIINSGADFEYSR